jgi:hypothetical protein
MKIYCIAAFKNAIEKLAAKKPYKDIMSDVAGYFEGKTINEICSGTRLNNSDSAPYIKKRLNGAGGYRLYFLVLIRNDNVFLIFIHPKTGPDGAENISDQSKAQYYKDVLLAIRNFDLLKVVFEQGKILFSELNIDDRKSLSVN